MCVCTCVYMCMRAYACERASRSDLPAAYLLLVHGKMLTVSHKTSFRPGLCLHMTAVDLCVLKMQCQLAWLDVIGW